MSEVAAGFYDLQSLYFFKKSITVNGQLRKDTLGCIGNFPTKL